MSDRRGSSGGALDLRPASNADALARASRCAHVCGVSRLADITGLDVLDVRVVQAVRPWSSALSVHQGKGWDAAAAMIGASMEAVESCSAEGFDGEARSVAFEDLPEAQRPGAADDVADRRGALAPARPVAWTPARRVGGGGVVWTAWWGVSLDATRTGEPGIERTSNGLAAGFDRASATLTAMSEVLERDAVAEWRVRRPHLRAMDTLDLQTIELAWFPGFWRRARDAGMVVAVYVLRAVNGWPVAMCEIAEPSAWPASRHRVYGSACRPRAAEALEAAVLEAAQTRLTFISAVRDDILPERRAPRPPSFGAAFPLPPGRVGLAWTDVVALDERDATPTTELAAERLAHAGYPQAAIVDIACPASEAVVVKAIVLGLGAYGRRRRGSAI